MVLTSDTISLKFIMPICISLWTFWTILVDDISTTIVYFEEKYDMYCVKISKVVISWMTDIFKILKCCLWLRTNIRPHYHNTVVQKGHYLWSVLQQCLCKRLQWLHIRSRRWRQTMAQGLFRKDFWRKNIREISLEWLKLETTNFVHCLATRSSNLQMTNCLLKWAWSGLTFLANKCLYLENSTR